MRRQPRHTRFYQHDLEARELIEDALGHKAVEHAGKAGRLRDIVFDIVGRPAEGARRMAKATARMDADWQVKAFRGLVDRPMLPSAKRHLGHRQHQYLHEAPIVGAALDLGHREIRTVRRDNNRGTQPGIAIEPFGGDPVVDGTTEGGRQVFTEHDLRAVKRVADDEARLKWFQHVIAQLVELRSRKAAFRAPVRPAIERSIWRIGTQFEVITLDAAANDVLAPIVLEIGQQGACAWHGKMDITVDRTDCGRIHDLAYPLVGNW